MAFYTSLPTPMEQNRVFSPENFIFPKSIVSSLIAQSPIERLFLCEFFFAIRFFRYEIKYGFTHYFPRNEFFPLDSSRKNCNLQYATFKISNIEYWFHLHGDARDTDASRSLLLSERGPGMFYGRAYSRLYGLNSLNNSPGICINSNYTAAWDRL